MSIREGDVEEGRGTVRALSVRPLLLAATRVGIPISARTRARLGAVSPLQRVPWDDVATLTEEIEAACRGDDDKLARFAAIMNEHAPELHMLAGALVDPRNVFRLIFAVTAWAYPSIRATPRFSRQRLELTLELGPDLRSSAGFFRVSEYCMAYAVCALGLPPCGHSARIEARRASYVFRLPPSRTWLARSRRAARELVGADPLDWLWSMRDELLGLRRRQESGTAEPLAPPSWGLTPREQTVLEQLARGQTNKQIASRLGCSIRTIEVHVTRILRKSGTSGRAELIARLWRG